MHRIKSPDSDTVHYLSRINDGIRALNKTLVGEELSDIRQSDLRWLERHLGLDKPLASYSSRTRQRYIAAAAHGRTAEMERARERQQRQQRQRTLPPISKRKWAVINAKRDRIKELGVDADPYLDDDVLIEVAKHYGLDYLVEVLTDQVESTESYVFNNSREPGHTRWNARGELEDRFQIAIPEEYLISGTDSYYYYHGHKP